MKPERREGTKCWEGGMEGGWHGGGRPPPGSSLARRWTLKGGGHEKHLKIGVSTVRLAGLLSGASPRQLEQAAA